MNLTQRQPPTVVLGRPRCRYSSVHSRHLRHRSCVSALQEAGHLPVVHARVPILDLDHASYAFSCAAMVRLYYPPSWLRGIVGPPAGFGQSPWPHPPETPAQLSMIPITRKSRFLGSVAASE